MVSDLITLLDKFPILSILTACVLGLGFIWALRVFVGRREQAEPVVDEREVERQFNGSDPVPPDVKDEKIKAMEKIVEEMIESKQKEADRQMQLIREMSARPLGQEPPQTVKFENVNYVLEKREFLYNTITVDQMLSNWRVFWQHRGRPYSSFWGSDCPVPSNRIYLATHFRVYPLNRLPTQSTTKYPAELEQIMDSIVRLQVQDRYLFEYPLRTCFVNKLKGHPREGNRGVELVPLEANILPGPDCTQLMFDSRITPAHIEGEYLEPTFEFDGFMYEKA